MAKSSTSFKKGQSGNPKGMVPWVGEIRSMARQYGPECVAKLLELMRDSEDVRVQFMAAKELLDRGFGKPEQSVDVNHEVTKYVIRLPDAQSTSIEWTQQHKPTISQ